MSFRRTVLAIATIGGVFSGCTDRPETLYDVIEEAIADDPSKAILISSEEADPESGLRLVGIYDGCANCFAPTALRVAIFEDIKRDETGRRIGVTIGEHLYCYPETGEVYVVPDSFETDFLSIPRPAGLAIRPMDFMRAAVIHDWLYAVGEKDGRKRADQVLKYVVELSDPPITVADAIYGAVRWRGEKPYADPEEWRFRDSRTGMPIDPPPIENSGIAVVETLPNCDEALDNETRQRILQKAANGG